MSTATFDSILHLPVLPARRVSVEPPRTVENSKFEIVIYWLDQDGNAKRKTVSKSKLLPTPGPENPVELVQAEIRRIIGNGHDLMVLVRNRKDPAQIHFEWRQGDSWPALLAAIA